MCGQGKNIPEEPSPTQNIHKKWRQSSCKAFRKKTHILKLNKEVKSVILDSKKPTTNQGNYLAVAEKKEMQLSARQSLVALILLAEC